MPSIEEEGPKPGDDAADDLTLGTNSDGGLLPGSEPTPVAPTAKDSGAIFNEHGLRIFKKRKDGMQLEAISLLGPNKLAKALLKGGIRRRRLSVRSTDANIISQRPDFGSCSGWGTTRSP